MRIYPSLLSFMRVISNFVRIVKNFTVAILQRVNYGAIMLTRT